MSNLKKRTTQRWPDLTLDYVSKEVRTIDSQFDWTSACAHDQSYGEDLDKKNELFYDLISQEIATQEEVAQKESSCAHEGKKIRSTNFGDVCISDYEYAIYQQEERNNAAEEMYRQQQIEQAEIDRKNAARRRALESLSNSLKDMGKQLVGPKTLNCDSNSYGGYTSTSCY